MQSCLRPPGPTPAHKAARRTTPGRRNNVQPHIEVRPYEPDGELVKQTFGPGGRSAFNPATLKRKQYFGSLSLVAEGVSIARAKYLEYHVHGTSTTPWPVVWTKTKGFIFLPPTGRKPVFSSGRYTSVVARLGVERWSVPRAEAIAVLSHVWDSVLHYGIVPSDKERSGNNDSTWAIRLSPSVFDVTTPIVDEEEGTEVGNADNDVVLNATTSYHEGVHLRMPPSSRPAAGTKRRAEPGGLILPGSHRG